MAGKEVYGRSALVGRRCRACPGGLKNHNLDEPFNSAGMSYLGQAVLRNSSVRVAFSPKSEIFVTNSASAAAPPASSPFSVSGSLAQRLGDAFLAVRRETERRAA